EDAADAEVDFSDGTNAIRVVKRAPNDTGTHQVDPLVSLPWSLEFTNTGTSYLPITRVTDAMPETLNWDGEQPTFTSTPGASGVSGLTADPAEIGVSISTDRRDLVFEWPAGSRMEPGETMTIGLGLILQPLPTGGRATNEVVVETPVGQPLAVDVLHGDPDERTEQERDGTHVTRMVWTRPRNVPDEPLAPHPTETIPLVVGSTFPSWDAFLEWYRAAVKGFAEPDDQVKRLAAELTRGATTRQEKIERLFDYVADTIRYVNYVSGEFWLPNRPQQVIARKQGDCDDKAILLISLLAAVGIEAREVLVQTRMTSQPSVLGSQRAAVPLFDHGIAYLPGKDGRPAMWLDATSPQSRLGPLPSMDARAMALFVKDGAAEVVAMPSSSPSDHGVRGAWKLELDASGGGILSAEERHAGDHGFELRTNLQEEASRAQWVEGNLLSGWFSGMRLEGRVGFEPNIGMGTAKVTYRAHSDGLARREGEDWVVPLAPSSTMTSQIAPLVSRKLPVVLPPFLAPALQERTLRIVAPAGFRPGPLPPGGEENGGEFGVARLQVSLEPGHPDVVLVTRSVALDLSTIPVERYTAWRSWLQRVDALMHRGVRFIPSKTRPATSRGR
ncbi:MAG TPA: transglutaminase-like domain-containing protein, partial [Polyangiaceae bacterium]|nr:transglutaminase-like domain-containing protein [Polyangiaceae bacterium]